MIVSTGSIKFASLLAALSLTGCSFMSERVEFTEVWHFRTPTGPKQTSGQFALVQQSSLPFLPGGDVGPTTLSGDMVVDFLDEPQSFRPQGPMNLHQFARGGKGQILPRIELDGLRNEFTTGFVRRIRNAQVTMELEREGMRHMVLELRTGSDFSLAQFEDENPGVTLERITLRIER